MLVSTALPFRYDQNQPMPLIVCMDGLWTLGTMVDAIRIMSMSGEAPEAIVVGVSFAEPRMSEYMRQRARWFSPSPWEPPEASGVKGVAAEECGRADQHMRFVQDQLLVSLGSEHTVADRWYFGHSFSALFGLRMLFEDPSLFDNWILASPSIWWDQRTILAYEQRYADANEDLAASVFISSGERETGAGLVADLVEQQPGVYQPDQLTQLEAMFNMIGNSADLAQTLSSRNYPNLTVTNQVLAGESHTSTIGSAISAGLRALHP